MFSESQLTTCMSDLIGWHQSANPCYTTLAAALKLSTSGFWINDLPGVDFDIITDIYANTEYTDISDYLTQVHSSERQNLFTSFVNRLKQKIGSKELLSNFPVISGVVTQSNTVTQNARFVGFRINPVLSNNLRTQITYVGIQINEILANPVKIYLYSTDQYEPIKTFDLSNAQKFSLEWNELTEWFCDFQSNTYGSGQSFLLGYYEYDPANVQTGQLSSTAKAYYLTFDCNCPTSAKRKWSQYVGIEPIELDNALLNWDAGLNEYTLPDSGEPGDYITNQTYGLVFKLNVTCDITPILCANKNMFAKALQYMIAHRILMDAYASTNVNMRAEKKEQFKAMAGKYYAELYGYNLPDNGVFVKGIFDNLSIDLSNIDSYCLPCKQTQPFTGRIIRTSGKGGCVDC